MMITKDYLIQEMDSLNEEQLQAVADFIAFVKFRARYTGQLVMDENQLGLLYGEFAEEDQQLAEAGMAEYADLLKEEDTSYDR